MYWSIATDIYPEFEAKPSSSFEWSIGLGKEYLSKTIEMWFAQGCPLVLVLDTKCAKL